MLHPTKLVGGLNELNILAVKLTAAGNEVGNVSKPQSKETILPNSGFGKPFTLPGTAAIKSTEPANQFTVPSSNIQAGRLFSVGATPSLRGTTQTTTTMASTGFSFPSQPNTIPPPYISRKLQASAASGSCSFNFGSPTVTAAPVTSIVFNTRSKPSTSSAAPSIGGIFQFGAISTTSTQSESPAFQFEATKLTAPIKFMFDAPQSVGTAASQPATFSATLLTMPSISSGTQSIPTEESNIFTTPSKLQTESVVSSTYVVQTVVSSTFGTPSTTGIAQSQSFCFSTPAKTTTPLFQIGQAGTTAPRAAWLSLYKLRNRPFGYALGIKRFKPSKRQPTMPLSFNTVHDTGTQEYQRRIRKAVRKFTK